MFFKKTKYLLFALSFLLLFTAVVFGYDNFTTHPKLSNAGIEIYNNQTNNKLTKQQQEWIVYGSIAEDADPRYLNHYYDPTTGKGLNGYDELYGVVIKVNGMSAKQWAQSQNSVTGDYSAPTIIQNYKSGNLKRAYQGIGHILHLIQDMSAPGHTRNDSHAMGDPYEKWVEQNGQINSNKASFIQVNNLDNAFDEMAKYSNENFFSRDTIDNKIQYDYYKIEKDSDGVDVKYLYRQNYKLIQIREFKGDAIYSFDEKVHADYWNLLSPKAIGYSAGMIDYFIKQFEKIDQENQKLSFWIKLKNNVSNVINNIKYTFGDVEIIGQTAVAFTTNTAIKQKAEIKNNGTETKNEEIKNVANKTTAIIIKTTTTDLLTIKKVEASQNKEALNVKKTNINPVNLVALKIPALANKNIDNTSSNILLIKKIEEYNIDNKSNIDITPQQIYQKIFNFVFPSHSTPKPLETKIIDTTAPTSSIINLQPEDAVTTTTTDVATTTTATTTDVATTIDIATTTNDVATTTDDVATTTKDELPVFPDQILDLTVLHIFTSANSIKLSWTSGKNSNINTSTSAGAFYDIRYNKPINGECGSIIDNWDLANKVEENLPVPSEQEGIDQEAVVNNLASSTEYCFNIKIFNNNSWSDFSNIVKVKTKTSATQKTEIARRPQTNEIITQTLTPDKSPYYIKYASSMVSSSTLTIEPGVVIKFELAYQGQWSLVPVIFSVCETCSIQANGTDKNPIVFTSIYDDDYSGDTNGDGPGATTAPNNAFWGGFQINSGNNVFNNTIFRYGGVDTGGIISFYNYGNASNLISNSIFDKNINGVSFQGFASNNPSIIENNIFNNFQNSAIVLSFSSNPIIRHNNFFNNLTAISIKHQYNGKSIINYNNIYKNTNYGIIIYSPLPNTLVDAKHNWWGSETGPNNTLTNPNGQGDKVGGNIDYSEWAIKSINN